MMMSMTDWLALAMGATIFGAFAILFWKTSTYSDKNHEFATPVMGSQRYQAGKAKTYGAHFMRSLRSFMAQSRRYKLMRL